MLTSSCRLPVEKLGRVRTILQRVLRASAALALSLGPFTVGAKEPLASPQIRVEADMHASEIFQIRGDLPRNRVISIGFDKTIRIWQLPSLRLVRTIHVPSDFGNEGTLFALAVSPDGRTIAAGGWTGWDWDTKSVVYLFNADTGDLIQRIVDLPSIVGTLGFSTDGRKLAVGLHGGLGLKIYDTSSYTQIAEDKEYGARISYLEYSIDGKLGTTAQDGYVRIYDANNKIIGRQDIGISKQLGGVRFSPDGSKLAFGVMDKPVAAVISANTMDVVTVKRIDNAKQLGLCCIGWSQDGRYLYVDGAYRGDKATPLYRFDEHGLGRMETLHVGNQNFTNMLPLPDGSMAFSTATPSFGLIDKDGKLVRALFGPNGDFREGAKDFLLSADGGELIFPMTHQGKSLARFSVADLQYVGEFKGSVGSLKPARHSAPGMKLNIKLADLQASPAPVLNGNKLELDKFETVFSYAIAPDGKTLAIATSWSLRLYDLGGKLLWRTYLPATGHNVNISGDGRWAVVTIADGTIRWYPMQNGKETLGLFPHRNKEDWVLWRPDGYYASSVNGDQYIGWLLNRGKNTAPDFYRAVQFERIFYRPDLVRAQLGSASTPAVLTTAENPAATPAESIRSAGTRGQAAPNVNAQTIKPTSMAPGDLTIDRLTEFAPPRIKIRRAENTRGKLALEFDAEKNSRPMQEFAVYINGIPVTQAKARSLAGGEAERFTRQVELSTYQPENRVRVEVSNGMALGLAETYVEGGIPAAQEQRPRGDLYLLVVGVNLSDPLILLLANSFVTC